MWETYSTRADLRRSGMTERQIAAAVGAGELIRARRDCYLLPGAPDDVVRALRVGGRLTCLSLLRLNGVFVLDDERLHVHVAPDATRMRSPYDRGKRLRPRRAAQTRLHWWAPTGDGFGAATCVDAITAMAHSVRCQTSRGAIASFDSALNRGLLTLDDLSEVFDLLPLKYRVLIPLIDGRAQSGTETLVRLMVLGLGCRVRLQVAFEDVGFVDLLVDDWLVIECDSKEFHSSWEQQVKDRRRDLALARQGFGVLRVTAADVFQRPDDVLAALRGLLFARAGGTR